MKNFDFNLHFQKFYNNKFFNDKTYAETLADISSFSQIIATFTNVETIALKIQSPYLAFVAILACLKENKTSILISHLESHQAVEILKGQIYFEKIIEDHHFKNITPLKIHSQLYPLIDQNKGALILFSSGSTSTPKGILLSFNNIYFSAKGFSDFFQQTEDDCSYINLPHHHVGGLMILWRTFFTGGKIISEFTPQIDFISLVPLQLKRMIEEAEKLSILKKIKVILIGGSKLHLTLKEIAQGLDLAIYETYGMTETASLLLINGKVLPYREVKLDNLGFFNVKGKTLALGHYQSNQFFPMTEWFKTNDQGSVDPDGFFQFTKRADLIFISGGENINPLYVEEVVKQNPYISDAYLVPITDEKWGEMGLLLYQSNAGENVDAFLKPILHPHLLPKFYFNISLNNDGQLKAKRSELKKIAQALYLKQIFSFDYFKVKNAPLIIFFHGFMGDKDDLKNISKNLDGKYSRLFIDLPGHGNTKIENFYSFLDFFQKITSFIRLFSNQPIFYGYSMGGRIALHLALNYLAPSSLILESAGLGLDNLDEQLKRQIDDKSLLKNIEQIKLPEFLHRWYQSPMFKTFKDHPCYKNEIEKRSLHNVKEWHDSQKIHSVGNFPLINETLEKLSATSFPVVYIFGEEDHKYKNMAYKAETKLGSKRIKLKPIKDSGHVPHKTNTAEIADFLNIYLK